LKELPFLAFVTAVYVFSVPFSKISRRRQGHARSTSDVNTRSHAYLALSSTLWQASDITSILSCLQHSIQCVWWWVFSLWSTTDAEETVEQREYNASVYNEW